MKKILLTRGQCAIVDDSDFPSLNKNRWYALWSACTKSFYAVRKSPRSEGHKTIGMARVILGIADKKMNADHINHDTLDNRRTNLRAATHAQNRQNRRGAQSNSATGVLGVYPCKKTGGFQAQIRTNGRVVHLGLFDNIKEASAARAMASIRYHGEFAGGGADACGNGVVIK